MQNNETQMEGGKVALTLHSLVDPHKDVEIGLGEFQQRSIFVLRQPASGTVCTTVAGQRVLQSRRKALV